MNSKEALKSLCNQCETLKSKNVFIGCPFRNISNDYCEEFETIEKDLEGLEILKNYIDYYICRNADDQSCINIVIPESVMNYAIIKEWLDE